MASRAEGGKMKLQVSVLEAKGLPAADSNGFSDPYVRLNLGPSKARTSVKYKDLDPTWREDFVFVIEDADEELNVEVWDEDRFTDDFLGQVKVPISSVLNADKHTLNRIWYPLQKRSESSKAPVSGDICLSLSVFGKEISARKIAPISTIEIPPLIEDNLGIPNVGGTTGEGERTHSRTSSIGTESSIEYANFLDKPASPMSTPYADSISDSNTDDDQVGELGSNRTRRFSKRNRKWKDAQRVASRISGIFKKPGKHSSRDDSLSFSESSRQSGMSTNSSGYPTESDANTDDEQTIAPSFFDDDNDDNNLTASLEEIPAPLSGGVLIDQNYGVSTKALNSIIFKSGSTFVRDLIVAQRSTEYVEEPWSKARNGQMTRVTSYIKAATKLVKALKATEVQTYTRADGKCYCVLCTVATPDAPYGGTFLVEVQICISAPPDLPGDTKSCHLLISYRVNFLQSTMMKGMIEGGCRTGIRESYAIYQEVLEKHAPQVSVAQYLEEPVKGIIDDEERPISAWEEAWHYFGKWNVLLALLSLIFVIVHIFLSPKRKRTGLDFWGVHFPDSLTGLITSAIVVIQVERVVIMVYDYVRARYWQSGDHGLKAQGVGWYTTITLIEGENIVPTDSGVANPYVVFTCNGKSRTSSVKLRSSQPNWREIFEFDATEDPPSTLDVEVFDYDGPFSEPETLGHAEINFIRKSLSDLSDVWISLDGKNARAHGSKLHLRVFLSNTKDSNALPDYLERVEREVGLKATKRSSQRNESFQKLFSVPAEEFLYNDFACAVKRRILIQGRLFLSVRLLGFYSNLFGHKTKFALLWEDIEEIKELSQSINPSIVVFLRKGRGFDARHGARGIDGKGRLKFTFLSFLRSGTAFKTIVALWKNRNLSPEQRMDIVASVVDGDMRYAVFERQQDDSRLFHGFEDTSMSEILSIEIPITAESVLSTLNNDEVDQSISEKLGLDDYETSPWDHVEETTGAHRRKITYALNRQISQFGSKVSCIQQQEVSDDLRKLVIKEILTYHDMPFADHFEVHVKRELETLSLKPVNTQVKAFVGVVWHKSTEAQKKVTKNIHEHMAWQIQELTNITVAEVFQRSGTNDSTKVADDFSLK